MAEAEITETDITVPWGATYVIDATYEDADSNPITLVGATAKMQVRKKSGTPPTSDPYFTLTETDGIVLGGVEGTVVVTISGANSALIAAKVAAYDLVLVLAGGQIVRLLEGTVFVDPGVTVLP